MKKLIKFLFVFMSFTLLISCEKDNELEQQIIFAQDTTVFRYEARFACITDEASEISYGVYGGEWYVIEANRCWTDTVDVLPGNTIMYQVRSKGDDCNISMKIIGIVLNDTIYDEKVIAILNAHVSPNSTSYITYILK